jgi:hypothetical protein
VEPFLASAAQSQPPRTAGLTLLDREVYDEVLKLLTLHGTIADHENQWERIQEEREKIYNVPILAATEYQEINRVGAVRLDTVADARALVQRPARSPHGGRQRVAIVIGFA